MIVVPSRQSPSAPAPTQPPPAPPSRVRRKRRSDPQPRHSRFRRQTISDQAAIDQAKAQCENSSNDIISCWPQSDTVLVQNEWTQFVWNSQIPTLTQENLVDIYLVSANSGDVIVHFQNQTNPFGRAGFIPLQVNDSWWGNNPWPGKNASFPFYFLAVRSDKPMQSAVPQSTFTAVQTTFANSVLAAMSTSAAAASSSASLSSASVASLSSALASASARANGSGLQSGSSDSSFPHWAIAVIVILGFFAIIAFVTLMFLILRTLRKRREMSPSRRGSMGSQSPMMANIQQGESVTSPLVGPSAHGPSVIPASGAVSHAQQQAASAVSPDGASTLSRATSNDGPFSGADAAVMAEAFRKALRKPDFADGPVEEGESPEASSDPPEEELISRELAEEGRDIRSVSSSRGVKVENLNDEGVNLP